MMLHDTTSQSFCMPLLPTFFVHSIQRTTHLSRSTLYADKNRWSYFRWSYSNPGQLYPPPPPPNFNVVFFFQGLRRVDKRNQTPQQDMSRTARLTLTCGDGGCQSNLFLKVWKFCPSTVPIYWLAYKGSSYVPRSPTPNPNHLSN